MACSLLLSGLHLRRKSARIIYDADNKSDSDDPITEWHEIIHVPWLAMIPPRIELHSECEYHEAREEERFKSNTAGRETSRANYD